MMGYSAAMMTKDIPPAPDLTEGWRKGREGYPSRGPKLGPAWAWCWTELHRTEEWHDGRLLAGEAAKLFDLKEATVSQLLTRMATAGKIEREHRAVATGRGPRQRTFYRIKTDA
jgi:hypothetical protein